MLERLARAAGLRDDDTGQHTQRPDSILLKPGKPLAEEYAQIKFHTAWGAKILAASRFPIIQLAAEIAMYHHEKWDGTGYNGMSGEQNPCRPASWHWPTSSTF